MTTRCKLTVKAQCPDTRATYYVEAYRGKVWITAYDCPFTCEAIRDPAQAAALVSLITQATKEARGSRP